MEFESQDTIVALATAPGRGGVGVVRVSGVKSSDIAKAILSLVPPPREAVVRPFRHFSGDIIDVGLALYFKAPHSFTGEDVLELQAHGGPVLMEMLLMTALHFGARMAAPGEFSQRAFLNGKMDLTQAEAVADLIDASTTQATLSASRSLRGEFSKQIDLLAQSIMSTRMYVEAAIDFPEEEIDFLSDQHLLKKMHALIESVGSLLAKAKQGQLLKEGMRVAIVGQPNAGKSSLLNCLTQSDTAIVTPIAGTTRDLIRETIQIDGLPIHIVDTAGIRNDADLIEQEGIKRAKEQQALADRILLVIDCSKPLSQVEDDIIKEFGDKVTLVKNKIDLSGQAAKVDKNEIYLSAKTEEGVMLLKEHLKQCIGFQSAEASTFIARRRHLEALKISQEHIQEALQQLIQFKALELCAHELMRAHEALGTIIGKVTTEDLLGEIFSSFCIGK